MRAIGTWPALAVGALVLLAGAPAAAVVDSPRLEQVTCHGLRILQSGLPPQRLLVVEITNPETGQEFARQQVLSDAAGGIDASITAGFHGARQLAVEVEAERGDEGVEFAETIHEFDRACPAAPASAPASRPTRVPLPVAVAVAVAIAVLVGAGWAVRMVRGRRG
jgi:hypothetical protein